MEFVYPTLPWPNLGTFQDLRGDEVVVYDDDGYPIINIELEEAHQ